MPVEGRGLGSRSTQEVARAKEIGNEPATSGKGSEAAGGVARQSEGVTQVGELTEEAYRAVDIHARYRLRQWLCAKHKVQGQGTSRFPDEYLDQTLGLVKLQSRTRNFPWANA